MSKLQLHDVTLAYGTRVVLQNISFETQQGETLGIVGPNGCGKSTLIKAITRLLPPSSGRILIDGRDVARISPSEIAKLIAVVPQTPILPDAFTALEVVLMGRTPHLGFLRYESRRDVSIALHAMEMTQTPHLSERRIGELSGGERQRLVIARALTQEPRIVLLDEPTAHLDINYQVETLDLISSLCAQQGLTALIALHDLNLAAQYCDRIIMISDGRIYAEGLPREVITEQNVRQVYGAEVCVTPHPVNNLPATLITANGSKNLGSKKGQGK
jgi:iron complex transport system ATP-binding protein